MAPRLQALALVLSAFALLPTTRSWAQRERFTPAPASIQQRMKPRGISLAYLRLPANSDAKETWAHLYVVVPKNVSPEGVPARTPFTRAYFIESRGVSIPIPFYLDIFTGSGKTLQRRNSIVFHQQVCPADIDARWREPDKKRGLVLMLDFMIGNQGLWHAIPLDDRFQVLSRQQFFYEFDTAEPDYNTRFSYRQTDTRGFLKLETLISNFEKKQSIGYEWQGSAFVDPLAPYLVVAATRKTRKAAESFAVKQNLQEYEILSTREYSDYQNLPPDSYVVIVKRLRDSKQTEEYARQKGYKIVRIF